VGIIALESAPSYHHRIEDLPSSIRPRERLEASGAQSLSDDELLAILFRTGTAEHNAVELGTVVLKQFGGLEGLERHSLKDLAMAPGIGRVKAVEIKAALELGKRLLTKSPEDRPQITGPRDVYALLRSEMAFADKETVRVLLLNTKHRVQNVVEVTRGTLNSSPVRIGELFKDAIRQQAANIVMVHNHPSGDPTPSADDVSLTRRAVEAGKLLDIELLDHVVIGRPGPESPGWVSLKERGLGWS
jgi:DNA repair protein RadC